MSINLDLILDHPPPLDPAWLAHETAAGLLTQPQVTLTPKQRQQGYSQRCKDLNKLLLSGQESHLQNGIDIKDTFIPSSKVDHQIGIRSYTPSSSLKSQEGTATPTVIYYHGGGLYVGDLDSEDLACRRICLAQSCTVYSIDYRLMPEFTADDALSDALEGFRHVTALHTGGLILAGSSSGGQLAAQISQVVIGEDRKRIIGVLLRGPVLCDATSGGTNIPTKFKEYHKSMSPEYHTSLLAAPALNKDNRTKEKLPLEVENLSGLPRHWVQVCTNDVYYSDGVCYAEALRLQGVEVKLDVVVGYPHTFWLKAPFLERAMKAESDMIEGIKWLVGF
ncbi:alpha/beta-Hydrolase [Glarea lozoyensis ATCC 20868]|uniref:Alpha/beta-Hydrolase n=1 Tax=Glarea lozoyensis (strain ATCC 20868 / MF5171) TaxID=1116229 RepID=S3CNC6_GLAL2|nr:alpha/beta-Hydrolase [Glarea lozoyensis ATCC 20868]EPE26684.1 alpha/beta-Hydrolase [Glarea lozoyensis ATCC 20868]